MKGIYYCVFQKRQFDDVGTEYKYGRETYRIFLYVINYNLGDDLNSEVKLTCLLYKVSVNVKVFISSK
jgi:hypothetical protein